MLRHARRSLVTACACRDQGGLVARAALFALLLTAPAAADEAPIATIVVSSAPAEVEGSQMHDGEYCIWYLR